MCRFNVWHTQTLVIAIKSRVNWLEDISKFKKIEANNRRCQYGQLEEKKATNYYLEMDTIAFANLIKTLNPTFSSHNLAFSSMNHY